MQNRRWPRDVIRAALFCAGLVLIALAMNWWAGYRECYDALRVGMQGEEARAILKRHGYKPTDCEGSHHEITWTYRRRACEPPIFLSYGMFDGVVTYKERPSLPEHLLQSLSDRIRGYD